MTRPPHKRERATGLDRRGFFKTCLTTAAAVAANPRVLAQDEHEARPYNRVMLVDHNGDPIGSDGLAPGRGYVFNYPYVTTPCFIINLGHAVTRPLSMRTGDHRAYRWPGGTGPEHSVVAFSAICAHKLSYPTRYTSFINFRPEEITFLDHDEKSVKKTHLIYCCSERSVYDPARGARVLGGPAGQPLTTILLEYDGGRDRYYAVATLGGEMYESFFEKFEFRIALENPGHEVRQLAESTATVLSPEQYTEHRIEC